MKKIRLVSMLLCLVMLLSFMAVPAAAAESAKRKANLLKGVCKQHKQKL